MNEGDGELDAQEFLSVKELEAMVKAARRHGRFTEYDDVADKELKERSIARRVRKDFDKQLWDLLRGDREWAWKVIVVSCAMLSNGMGFAISNFIRTGKGGDGKIENGALWLALFMQWREAAEKKGLSPDMCVDLLWRGLGFWQTDRKHKRRRHTSRANLEACLDLLLDMRSEARLHEWNARWKDKGYNRGIAAGIDPELYEREKS